MNFMNRSHKECYLTLLSRMRTNDAYHRSAAYLMALANLPANAVFNFRLSHIKHEAIFEGWQTSSTLKTTRLLFNLWNGTSCDVAAERPEETCYYYTVDEIFSNYEYAPWFMEAVKIRFELDDDSDC